MRYPGGKGASWRSIVNLLPPHARYVEPFLGGGNVLEHKAPAPGGSLGLDLDEDAVRAWRDLGRPDVEVRRACGLEWLRAACVGGLAPRTLVYLDPPYLHATRRQVDLYRHELGDRDHEELLDLLVALDRLEAVHLVISGYASELYDRALASWSRVTYTAGSRQGPREEVVWFNYARPEVLHDDRELGDGYRERERIRRKRRRWVAGLARLPLAERRAILRELVAADADLLEDLPAGSGGGRPSPRVAGAGGVAYAPAMPASSPAWPPEDCAS